MSTNDSNILQTEPCKRVVARRTIATIPTRSVDNTWEAVTSLTVETLQLRSHARVTEVETVFDDLSPLAGYFLTRHALEGGLIEFDMADLTLVYTLSYGQADVNDVLSLPPIEILGPMSPEAILTLTFYLTISIQDPFVTNLVKRINDEGVVLVKIEYLEPDPFAYDEKSGSELGNDSNEIPTTPVKDKEECDHVDNI